MESESSLSLSPIRKSPQGPVKKVSFPGHFTIDSPKPRLSTLAKSKSVIPQIAEATLTKPFKPLFACFRTKYLDLTNTQTSKKQFHHKKRASNFSLMSTMPTALQGKDDTVMGFDDETMYAEGAQNKVEIKANLVEKTKLRTLNALASILKNRKNVTTDTLKKMRGSKKMHAYNEMPAAQANVHVDSYDTVVKLLKAAQPSNSLKKRQIKVMVDLPKLPFGRHVSYNSVTDFKQRHVVDFEPSAQLMDKVTNEIWIKKMERRKTLGVDLEPSEKKPELEVNFQSEELQLYNSKLKVAEENLYMHYSTGSKLWKRDMMEKQAGWRGLYRLEVKRMSDTNVTAGF